MKNFSGINFDYALALLVVIRVHFDENLIYSKL